MLASTEGQKGRVVSRCTGRANGKRFLSIWVGVNGFGHRQTPFYPGPRLEKRLCSKWMEGEREILLRANVPETGGGEDLAEIFAGIETPSFSSSFSRPCSTSDWFPSNSNFVLPGTRWIWFFHRILFYQGVFSNVSSYPFVTQKYVTKRGKSQFLRFCVRGRSKSRIFSCIFSHTISSIINGW